MNWLIQIIGFGAFIMLGLSYWQAKKQRIMLWQMGANLLFSLHYFLLKAWPGALCSVFQIVVLLLFTLGDKYKWKRVFIAVPVVLIFILIAVVTYKAPITLLPILGSLLSLLPFFQSNRRVIQISGIFSALAWLVYVISVGSYSGILTESVLAVLTAASLIKRPKKAKNSNV